MVVGTCISRYMHKLYVMSNSQCRYRTVYSGWLFVQVENWWFTLNNLAADVYCSQGDSSLILLTHVDINLEDTSGTGWRDDQPGWLQDLQKRDRERWRVWADNVRNIALNTPWDHIWIARISSFILPYGSVNPKADSQVDNLYHLMDTFRMLSFLYSCQVHTSSSRQPHIKNLAKTWESYMLYHCLFSLCFYVLTIDLWVTGYTSMATLSNYILVCIPNISVFLF